MPSSIFTFTLPLGAMCLLSFLILNTRAQTSPCDCYITSGPSLAYFANHSFYDFRNINTSADTGSGTIPPPVSDNMTVAMDALSNSSFLKGDVFTNDWVIQNWGSGVTKDSPVAKQNSMGNVFILRNPTFTSLVLRTTRHPTYQSTAEINSNFTNLYHASIRVLARVSGPPGACAGLFTYTDDSNEADIEVLTRDPNTTIQYTNQPSVDQSGNAIPGAMITVTLPEGLTWSDWNVHRIDWLEDRTEWYVNGQSMATNQHGVPSKPALWSMNLWSDGGVWSGNMTLRGSAYLQIQWVEMAYNVTGSLSKRARGGCKIVCAIDSVPTVGMPEVVFNFTSGAAMGREVWSGNARLPLKWWVMVFWVLLVVLTL